MTGLMIALITILIIIGLLSFIDYRSITKEPDHDPWQEEVPPEVDSEETSKLEPLVRILHRLSFYGFLTFLVISLFFLSISGMAGLMGLLTIAIAGFLGLFCSLMSMILVLKYKSLSRFEGWSGVILFVVSILPALFGLNLFIFG